MSPPILKFWSISRKEIPESQQKHSLRIRFLRTLLCSNDIFNPGYNRKMLMKKRTSILDEVCVNYEQLFHPVQCTACRLCQCSSREKLALPKVTGILSLSDPLLYLCRKKCFGGDARQYTIFNLSESVWKFTNTFSYHYFYLFSFLAKLFVLWNQFLQCLPVVAFQLQPF